MFAQIKSMPVETDSESQAAATKFVEIFEDFGAKEASFLIYRDADELDDLERPGTKPQTCDEIDESKVNPIQESIWEFSADSPGATNATAYTLTARIKRMAREMEELERDIEAYSKHQPSEGRDLATHLKSLDTTLSGLHSNWFHPKSTGPFPSNSLALLERDVAAFKERGHGVGGMAAPAESVGSHDSGGQLVYKLMLDAPNDSNSHKDAKIAQLEQRITNLEKVIGLHEVDPVSTIRKEDRLSLFATCGTLIGAMERLDHHLSLLTNPQIFEAALRRIKDSIATMERLQELKRKHKLGLDQTAGMGRDTAAHNRLDTAHPEVSSSQKIAYLYNQMHKLDAVSNVLPHLIQRLSSLQTLHSEAANFAKELNSVQEGQRHLEHMSRDVDARMADLLKSMVENQERVVANIASLDSRIAKLS